MARGRPFYAIAGLLALCAATVPAAAPPFGIVNAVASQIEDGPKPAEDYEFRPGETVYLSFQIAGVKASPQNTVKFKYEVKALDPMGTPIVPTISRAIDSAVSPEDKNWIPKVRESAELPPLGPGGLYKFLVAVTAGDEKPAVKEVAFRVRGRAVEPSAALAFRNFTFFRSDEDRSPLAIAAFRPGDAVWARFDLAGYKIAEGNKFDVDYLVSVTGPAGNVLYTQPEPTAEQGAPFYPKRYVPAEFSLNLAKDASPGEYGLTIAARDNVGAQKIEVRQVFRVE